MINSVLFAVLGSGVVFLAFCILYLVFAYRKILEKYYELLNRETKGEIKRSIELKADRFVSGKIDSAISKSINDASTLIEKNAKNVVNSMKRQTARELIEERQAEERAISSEFDDAKDEVSRYKAQEFEEIRLKANEVLRKVASESLSELFKEDKQEEAVMKALENAKRSNIF